MTEVGRALRELGVEVIFAHSAQAKGRVERLFRTFQDRLVKEMRLRKIKTIEDGNRFLREYLPVYNKSFAVPAAKGADLHRPLPKSTDLNRTLCVKTGRVLRNDFTVAFNNKLYQVEDNVRDRKVIVEERIDGSMIIAHKNKVLKFKEIDVHLKKEEPKTVREFKPKRIYEPVPANHPWRSFRFGTHYPQYSQKEKVAPKEKELLLTVA